MGNDRAGIARIHATLRPTSASGMVLRSPTTTRVPLHAMRRH
jgi:hypothetical protein